MKKFQNRNVLYIITVESVQKMMWRISENFHPTGSDFNLSRFYGYRESSYSRVHIRHNKMNCFHLYNGYMITD